MKLAHEAKTLDEMTTVLQMVKEIKASSSEFVTYGESDIGIAVERIDAIADIEGLEDEQIGDGTWYECDKNGNITE